MSNPNVRNARVLTFSRQDDGTSDPAKPSFDEWLEDKLDRSAAPEEQIEQARREIRALFVRRARALGEI